MHRGKLGEGFLVKGRIDKSLKRVSANHLVNESKRQYGDAQSKVKEVLPVKQRSPEQGCVCGGTE